MCIPFLQELTVLSDDLFQSGLISSALTAVFSLSVCIQQVKRPENLIGQCMHLTNSASLSGTLTFSVVEVEFDGLALVNVQVREPHGGGKQHQQ